MTGIDPDDPALDTRGHLRPLCNLCGPGYRIGDDGCRHTDPDERPSRCPGRDSCAALKGICSPRCWWELADATPTDDERPSPDWTTTLHLAYLDGSLCGVAICKGTVSDVAQRTMLRHLPEARLIERTAPIGERDWPVRLVYEGTHPGHDGAGYHWRHEFRRPDDQWPMADAACDGTAACQATDTHKLCCPAPIRGLPDLPPRLCDPEETS